MKHEEVNLKDIVTLAREPREVTGVEMLARMKRIIFNFAFSIFNFIKRCL